MEKTAKTKNKKPIFNPYRSEIYSPKDIRMILQEATNEKSVVKDVKGVQWFNIPVAFDIETTSFYRDENGGTMVWDECKDDIRQGIKYEKLATMYVWQFGINGYTIIGRTWDEFLNLCNDIADFLQLNAEKRKLIVYVHNLSFEFQFIRKLFDWEKVFSIDLRKPIYCLTKTGIEFRCSYLLSGYSLQKIGENLQRYKVAKMVGDLDYSKPRHTGTPLTEAETGYCKMDVIVLMCYIQEQIDNNKGIMHIPLTKTGFVRKHCRKNCLRIKEGKKVLPNWDYINLIQSLQISGLDEFDLLQRAFAGGFTHANAEYVGDIMSDVSSYDFTSSYPYVMVSEKFPMSKGVNIQPKSMAQFDFLRSKYACVFDIEFTGIFPKETQDNPISVSKCFVRENIAENNGRLVCASKVAMTITDVDFTVLETFYTWDKMRVGNMYCYKRAYLPTCFVNSILELYEKKTLLKGIEGKEVEYLNSKEMLNSCYGMTVTNPLRDDFVYNGEWDIEAMTKEQKEELLYKYNTGKNRFLFYPWGIFVTAYARRNLFTAIKECGNDYIYSDTDSVKILNAERHKAYFEAYNKLAVLKLKKACIYHKIDFSKCSPKNQRGQEKTLGIWDFEGVYSRFKTLGAKRYMTETKDAKTGKKCVSLTVSGVNKKTAIPYLLDKYGTDGIFEAFCNYLEIPDTATGKNLHTYIDYETDGEITDYKGVKAHFHEMTATHLEPTSYNLSLSVMFINYLRGIKLMS